MRILPKHPVMAAIGLGNRKGLLRRTEVELVVDGNNGRVMRAQALNGDSRNTCLIAYLRGQGNFGMSTDEIMALTRED